MAPELVALGCRRTCEPRLKCLGRVLQRVCRISGRAVTDLLVPLASDVRRRSTATRAGTGATLATHAAMAFRRVEARPEAPLSARANCTFRAKRGIRRATLATVVVPLYRISALAMVLARGEARGGRDDNEQHRRGRTVALSLARALAALRVLSARRGLASSHIISGKATQRHSGAEFRHTRDARFEAGRVRM